MLKLIPGAVLVAIVFQGAPPAPADAEAPPPPPARSAGWEKEPDGYRSVKWGGTLDDATEHIGDNAACVCNSKRYGEGRCVPTDTKVVPEERTCASLFDVGGITVKDQWHFLDDHLAGATMSFRADAYEQMRAAFIEKYGPPATTHHETVQNRMGGELQDEVLTWAGDRITITLQRYAGSASQSAALLTTKPLTALRAKRREEETKRRATEF